MDKVYGVDIEDSYEGDAIVERGLDQRFFPYIICDINISIDNTIYVHMLISIIQRDFLNIGNTNDINERLRANNSGIGYQTSQPIHLRPYSVFTYV